jgi:hypothetical protein
MQAIAAGGAAAALGAAGTASASVAPKAAAGAAALAKTTAGGFGVAKLLGVITVAVALGGGGYALSQRAPSSEVRENVTAPTPAPPSLEIKAKSAGAAPIEVAPSIEGAKDPLPAEPASEANAEAAAVPKAVAAVESRTAKPVEVEAADPLAVESEKLREANRLIAAGQADKALEILRGAHGSEMNEERTATTILAFCKKGRVDEANAMAARFVSEHPRSLLVDRMRRPCTD